MNEPIRVRLTLRFAFGIRVPHPTKVFQVVIDPGGQKLHLLQ
jgi:hypothetical protein